MTLYAEKMSSCWLIVLISEGSVLKWKVTMN